MTHIVHVMFLSLLAAAVTTAVACAADADPAPWRRHSIDASSRGADGVRLADVDGDGRLDVVTGWEEGGVIRVCRHPGPDLVRNSWPSVTVGNVPSPEDAVFVDLDRDGSLDVVSCCEGRNRTVFVHWAPADRRRYWDASAWSTAAIESTARQQAWMFCLPLPSEPSGRVELIAGSKANGATISRLVPSEDPRAMDAWRRQTLCEAGWIMSLRSVDMDGDGDADVLFSDRKGPTRGIAWLERPADPEGPWTRHVLGGTREEVMFLDTGDLTGDGRMEVVAATRSAGLIVCAQRDADGSWAETMLPMPPDCGSGKGIAVGDVDQDGRSDLVVSCEHSERKHGLFWLSAADDDLAGTGSFHPISGLQAGIKFDRLELLDLDADGDLDVMTCEERDNLGVIWYENPVRATP